MPNTDSGIHNGCTILPFEKPDIRGDTVTVTSLAAILAVTIIHDASISPEERLIDIIEQSGEVEILDTEDAMLDLGLDRMEFSPPGDAISHANDNALLTAQK